MDRNEVWMNESWLKYIEENDNKENWENERILSRGQKNTLLSQNFLCRMCFCWEIMSRPHTNT